MLGWRSCLASWRWVEGVLLMEGVVLMIKLRTEVFGAIVDIELKGSKDDRV